MAMDSRSGTASHQTLLEVLISRGWCFRSREETLDTIRRVVAHAEEGSTGSKCVMSDSVESELLSMDLRSFGGRSLPDFSTFKKSSHLQGPIVLQVVSTRDLYQSSIDASIKKPEPGRRLLRFVLTDGNHEVTAIEYVPIPAIKKEIVPGMKVRLENRVRIHNGILCLDPTNLKILGGVVHSLYEEWQLDQKYSGINRSTLKASLGGEGTGPPPFEKLRPEVLSHKASSQKCSTQSLSVSEKGRQQYVSTSDNVDTDTEVASTSMKDEDTVSTSDDRPKEAIEVMPIQNQAAAQKLLQKMSQQCHQETHYRGNRQRGKGKQDEAPVFTLEEWERKKMSTSKQKMEDEPADVNRDEELAWELQRQLDMEDSSHAQVLAGQQTEADKIRESIFNFEKKERDTERRRGSRGRGRGRGGRRFFS